MNGKNAVSGADAPEQIVKKLLGEVPAFNGDLAEIETFARFVGCDVALEYAGNSKGVDPFNVISHWEDVPALNAKLWLWSIRVMKA